MFCLRRPSNRFLERYRRACTERTLNFPGLSVASLQAPPAGFVRDSYGRQLGAGAHDYRAAMAALRAWAMYPAGWARVWAPPAAATPAWELDSVFVAVIRGYGVYTLLPGRVIEQFDEDGPTCRFGFSFATLRGHVECGVERFEVNWTHATDEVRFDALAISRPGPLLSLVAPLARRLQCRFHRESPLSVSKYMSER